MEIDPLWVLGGWITFSSSSSRYSSTCMAKPSSPSLSPATSHQKTLPIYHQLTKTSSTTTTTLKPSIFFISSLFFLLILTVARPSPHDQVVAVVQAATEVKLPESSVRTLGTKTFTTVAAVGRTLKSSESSAPGTGTAARDDSKATAVETTVFGPGKGHKHGPKTSSENEFKAAAHEVPSGPNPISN